jgi:type I restriction enzyme M protein
MQVNITKKKNVKMFLLPEHIDKIVDTYQYRKEDDKKYSRCVIYG